MSILILTVAVAEVDTGKPGKSDRSGSGGRLGGFSKNENTLKRKPNVFFSRGFVEGSGLSVGPLEL